MTEPRLQMLGISKIYPSVVANADVNLTVMPGEIHAVLGENGAGKSTLMKIIYGVVKPDEGQIMWEGRQVHIHSPHDARKLGIGMVFQHFALFETLTVAENIALALDDKVTPAALAPRIRAVSEQYGCRSIRRGWCTACRWASASASRLCAACCSRPSC
jgi:simple sugar transport system ATP-binding protein